MNFKNFLLYVVFAFAIIIIALFIELSYNKKHAKMVFLLPDKYIIIKGAELGLDDDVLIYNADEMKRSEVYKHIQRKKRHLYYEKPIEEHLSRKMSKPFDSAVNDTKENYVENMPVSFIYKTAVNVVDFTRDLTTGKNESTPYRMLLSRDSKINAFIDRGNIYVI